MVNVTWELSRRCNINCDFCFFQMAKQNIKPYTFDIDGDIRFLKSLDTSVNVHLTGGEPFLSPGIFKFLEKATKLGLTFNINTNLTVNLKPLLEAADLSKIFIHASIHAGELERLKLQDIFLRNLELLNSCTLRGFYLSDIAYPGYSLKDVNRYREKYTETLGIDFKYDLFYGFYLGKYYPDNYSDEDIDRFKIRDKLELYKSKENSRFGKLCNAGSGYIAIVGREVFPCTNLTRPKDSLGTLDNFKGKLKDRIICQSDCCGCPVFTDWYKPMYI